MTTLVVAAIAVLGLILIGVGVRSQQQPDKTVPPAVLVGENLPARQPPATGPKEVPVRLGIDGCDRNYDSVNTKRDVCVPIEGPDDRPVDCAYLKELGLGELVVLGTDVKKLGGPNGAAKGAHVCA